MGARGDINGILFGHYIYIMGGMTHENNFCKALTVVEAYDINADKWILLNDMNIGRADMSVIKYHSLFYVLGGEIPDTSSSTICHNNNNDNNNNTTNTAYNKFTVDTKPL